MEKRSIVELWNSGYFDDEIHDFVNGHKVFYQRRPYPEEPQWRNFSSSVLFPSPYLAIQNRVDWVIERFQVLQYIIERKGVPQAFLVVEYEREDGPVYKADLISRTTYPGSVQSLEKRYSSPVIQSSLPVGDFFCTQDAFTAGVPLEDILA